MHLTFRTIRTDKPNSCLEFLDVNHVADPGSLAGFYTTNYIKPTAQNRTFLNGRSYHPRSTFRSIIYCECIRLKRLNERQDLYIQAIDELKAKCLKSGFNKEVTLSMTEIAKTWTERFRPPKDKKAEKRTVWATSFPNLLRPSGKERALNNKAQITYRRPQTLGQQLTKYKSLALNEKAVSNEGSCQCSHCSLCGNHGKGANMVVCAKSIRINSKEFKIQRTLTCADWGIYAAVCKICDAVYVGQTSTSFSKRFNSHRHIWKKGCKEITDQAALRCHYDTKHPDEKGRTLPQAFKVFFVDQPNSMKQLDLCESLWVNRLQAQININKTLLPRFT